MALRYKSKSDQVRLVFTDAPGRAMPESAGLVFGVIGPFTGFADKPELQRALEMLLRGWNVESAKSTHSAAHHHSQGGEGVDG